MNDTINIELSECTLKNLIVKYLEEKLGSTDVNVSNIKIMVKSKQNYRAEWEVAAFRATFHQLI